MKSKEPSKCREWEKVRRDKLNKSFQTLSKLLPNYDPSLTLSKIDILQKATDYIDDLQKKLKEVLTGDGIKKTEREEVKQLYERIRKLLLRNEQLCNLLKDAGIRVPSAYGTIKHFKEPLRWANKITPDQAKQFAAEEAQKENKKDTNKPARKPKPKKGIKKVSISPSKLRKRDPKKSNKKITATKKPAFINLQLQNVMPIARPNLAVTTTRSCFIITNPPIGIPARLNCQTKKAAPTVVTNSSSLAAPKMASIIKPPTSNVIPKVNATLSSLGPGTLILANGNIVPILPQPAILTNPAPLLLKPSNNNTTLIVMPTKNKEATSKSSPKSVAATTTTSSAKTFANIKPRICITHTTQVNKMPIPALTSRYSDLPLSKAVADKSVKKNEAENISIKKVTVCKVKRKATNSDSDNKRLKRAASPDKSTVAEIPQKPAEKTVDKELPQQKDPVTNNSSDAKLENSCSGPRVPSPVMKNDKNAPELQVQDTNEKLEKVPQINTKETIPETATEESNINEKKTDAEVSEQISKPEIISEVVLLNKPQAENCKNAKCTVTSESPEKPPPTTSTTVASPSETTKCNPSTEIQDKNLELGMNLNHSELSNDIFSSLHVPIGGQNPESTSPTAAFLLAFPLVSSLTGVKVTEVIEEENSDSRHGTPTLLQIGTMDSTKTTQSIPSESLTPNLLNLDNFSFFSGKDMCSTFYSSFDNAACSTTNVYSVSSAQMVNNTKTSNCKEGDANSTKPKVEPPKLQNLQNKASTTETATLASVSYTTAGQINTKPNVSVTQNSYVRQNTSVTYSKVPTVTTSYMQYDARHKNISSTTTSACKDIVNYSTSNRKPSDTVISASQYNMPISTAQCNTFNPFSDFSKPNAVHSYATFSKSYTDPLYTNSSHYNYPHHNENNFEQGVYYPAKSIKPNVSTYNPPNYPDPSYDCKKRESNQRHNPINYYSQTKTPTKNQPKTSKPPSQPKPPINWMTTPDFRPQSSNTEYLVPPFAKDIEYNANSFYASNSFASTTHASYFNATTTMYTAEFQDNRKTFDSSLPIISTNTTQRAECEENQFTWSPTKFPQFLETSHGFVSSTLPTLVGDLALGTTQPPFAEQKIEQGSARDHLIKPKETNRRSKAHSVNYDNQSNFLSVSQLVENKPDPSSARNRRNSGNRSVKSASQKGNKHSHKTENKELVESTGQGLVIEKNTGLKPNQAPNINYMQGVGESWMPDCHKPSRHGHKNPQSSYSAEALIGHQDQDNSMPKQRYRQQQTNYTTPNKALPIPTFLSDNIVPYFPPVEIPQDNNFIQTNPNYQGSALSHTFSTSMQNNAYPSGTYISTGATISSSYLQSSGLIPDFGTHDYSTPISDNVIPHSSIVPDKTTDVKHCSRSEVLKQPSNISNRTEERPNVPQQINTDCSANSSNNFAKKSKHKHSNETNLPGLVDFSFLPMPSSINSPILPDDFHAHSNFLPPPTPSQLYPCKNPLYSKQSSDLNSGSLLPLPPVPVTRSSSQHFEPSVTVGNAGSSLTSFNLSAIFPEINKGPMPLPGIYPSETSRNKNYNFQKNYLSSSAQVTFSNKSTSSSSYVNSVPSSYAPTN